MTTTSKTTAAVRPIRRLATALGGLALLVGVAPLAGCYSPTVNSVEVSDSGGSKSTITDARLAKAARIDGINKGRSGDRLRVTVNVTNITDDSHKIAFRFSWLDQNKFPIESATTVWQEKTIQGQQSAILDGTAPMPEAADAKVELKLIF